MKAACLMIVCFTCFSLVHAESRPLDSSQPSQPRFGVGFRVEWSDGSLGRIVGTPQWEQSDTSGQWVYPVQFGGPDSLLWSLPEPGLRFIDE